MGAHSQNFGAHSGAWSSRNSRERLNTFRSALPPALLGRSRSERAPGLRSGGGGAPGNYGLVLASLKEFLGTLGTLKLSFRTDFLRLNYVIPHFRDNKEIMSRGPQVLDMEYREPDRLEHGPGGPILSFFIMNIKNTYK